MAKFCIPQTFRSIAEVKETFGTTLPRPHDWRLLQDQLVGEVNGLPGSHGTAVATNGILVAIVQPMGLYIGHIDHFIVDAEQTAKAALDKSVVGTKTKKQKIDIEDFV